MSLSDLFNPWAILRSPFAMIPWLFGFSMATNLALGWFSTFSEVFLRHSFGERYLDLRRFLMSLYSFEFFGYAFNLLGGLFGFGGNPMAIFTDNFDLKGMFMSEHSFYFKVFIWSYCLVCGWHFLTIWRRNLDGIEYHSYSYGISYLEDYLPWDLWRELISFIPYRILRQALEPSEIKILCVVEPVFAFLLAQALWRLDVMLGVWLTLSSIALGARNILHYMEIRTRVLDMNDSRIEGQYMQQALQGANKRTTAGFSVSAVATQYNREA